MLARMIDDGESILNCDDVSLFLELGVMFGVLSWSVERIVLQAYAALETNGNHGSRTLCIDLYALSCKVFSS